LVDGRKIIDVVDGRCSGLIALRSKGNNGFGYDPLFLVPGTGKTVGQLPVWLKQRLSHRAAAARRMKVALKKLAGRG
jgi:XTP/dITP diphosphohydrolase